MPQREVTLMDAIIHRDAAAVTMQIVAGADVNAIVKTGTNEQPLLNVAARVGDVGIVQQLVAAGASLNAPGNSSLHVAAKHRCFDVFALLARCGGAELCNAVNERDETPTHVVAASASDARFVEVLTSVVGVDFGRADCDGITPCHVAATNADATILAALLRTGVDVNVRDERDRRTPCHWAARVGSHEHVALLLQFGADAALVDTHLQTPVHDAAQRFDERVLRAFCRANVNLNLRNAVGHTPLMVAASNANTDVLLVALDAPGANLDVQASERKTVMHVAAVGMSELAIQRLVARGAAVDAHDVQLRTPLHDAARFGFAPVVAALLDAGANVTAVDSSGFGVCHFAARNRRSEVLELLLARGADFSGGPRAILTPLHCATLAVNPDAMRTLIDAGADVNARDHASFTPLHAAATARDIGAFRLLVESGADVRAAGARASVCHCAVGAGGDAIIAELCRAGADIDAPDQLDNTPLDCAAMAHDGADALVALVALGVRARHCPMRRTIYSSNAGLVFLAGGAVAGECDAVAAATRRVAAFQLALLRPLAFNACVGLHSLDMSALQLCAILEFALWPGELLVPFHTLWALATTVKHFAQ